MIGRRVIDRPVIDRPVIDRRAWLLCLALAGAIAAPAAPAAAYCRMTTSERLPTPSMPCVLPDPEATRPEFFLEWRRPCTSIALSASAMSEDLSEAEVRSLLQRSISSWTEVTCDGAPLGVAIDVLDAEAMCTEPVYRDNGANANTLMFVSDWGDRMYDPAAFAVTTVWHRKTTGEILDVDIEVNEERGPYGICPAEGCRDMRTVDLENVITHELGHYLGVAHSTEVDATMFASAVAGEVLKRDLHEDDIAGVCAVYPPGTPSAVCDATPRGGLRLDCQTGCRAAPAPRDQPRWPWLALAMIGLAYVASKLSSRASRATP